MNFNRYNSNPILVPNIDSTWEAEAVFNGCPVKVGKKTFLLYRALSLPQYNLSTRSVLRLSSIGMAESEDGVNFTNRNRLIYPDQEWDKYGCEDPRVTEIDGRYYIFYTALSEWPPRAEGIKVGVAISHDLETIERKHLVTPFNAKAMALFPEKIDGKFYAILSVNTDKPPSKICIVSFENEALMLDQDYWKEWYGKYEEHGLELKRDDRDHVEVGAPPIKTKHGWLLLYSHIRNYHSDNPLFGVEAVMLDLEDPRKIIARSEYPALVPEEYYELYGMVPNIVFPSGAMLQDDLIYLYYGAADTTCAVASVGAELFLENLMHQERDRVGFMRSANNPIIEPDPKNAWEARLTFNPSAIDLDGKVRIVYRAMSNDNTSVFGYAESDDAVNIDYRGDEPIYQPREKFEQKLVPNGYSGVEDPRLVEYEDSIYMFYTAFDGKHPPGIALTSIDKKDFLAQEWKWKRPVLISAPGQDNKDATMFPEKINGKFVIIHRVGTDIDLSWHDNLDFDGSSWLEEYRWIRTRKGWWDSLKVGAASTPFKTDKGWVVLYHGVSEEDHHYRVGAVLTELDDPTKIIGRSDYPLFEPIEEYELNGEVNNVVFPCGSIVRGDTVYIYYGGADKVIGVASMSVETLLMELELCGCCDGLF